MPIDPNDPAFHAYPATPVIANASGWVDGDASVGEQDDGELNEDG
jgi:hypothetical protein